MSEVVHKPAIAVADPAVDTKLTGGVAASGRFVHGNETYLTLVWRRFRRSTMGMIGLVLVLALILMAIFGDFFAPMDPKRADIAFVPPDHVEFFSPDGSFSLPLRLSDRRDGRV